MRFGFLYVIVVFIILIKGTAEKSIFPQRNNIKSTEITNKSNVDHETTNYVNINEGLDEPTDKPTDNENGEYDEEYKGNNEDNTKINSGNDQEIDNSGIIIDPEIVNPKIENNETDIVDNEVWF